MTLEALIGSYQPETSSWVDGTLTATLRKEVADDTSQWIVLDGPVDSRWMENLNTLLDETR